MLQCNMQAVFLRAARPWPRLAAMDKAQLSPIGGRTAWRGEELARSGFWPRRLSAGEIAALEEALAIVRGRGLAPPRFGAPGFPLPSLRPLLAAISEELEAGTGVVRLSGLP